MDFYCKFINLKEIEDFRNSSVNSQKSKKESTQSRKLFTSHFNASKLYNSKDDFFSKKDNFMDFKRKKIIYSSGTCIK